MVICKIVRVAASVLLAAFCLHGPAGSLRAQEPIPADSPHKDELVVTVTDPDGKAVANAEMSLYFDGRNGPEPKKIYSDSLGRATFDWLGAGKYGVRCRWTHDAKAPPLWQGLALTADHWKEGAASLKLAKPHAPLKVKVLDARTGKGVKGLELVAAYGPSLWWLCQLPQDTQQAVVSGDDGALSLPWVGEGDYTLGAPRAKDGRVMFLEPLKLEAKDFAAGKYEWKAALGRPTVVLKFRLKESSKLELPRRAGVSLRCGQWADTILLQNGQLTLVNVPAEQFTILSIHGTTAVYESELAAEDDRFGPVKKDTALTVNLIPLDEVKLGCPVKLMDAAGNPVGGVKVTLQPRDSNGKAISLKTDAKGLADFWGIPKGSYKVSVDGYTITQGLTNLGAFRHSVTVGLVVKKE